MTLFIFPMRVTNGFADGLIEAIQRRVQPSLIVDTVRRGEHFEAGNSEQSFTGAVGIASQMNANKRIDLQPVRKLARVLTRSGKQNDVLAEGTAKVQNVRMGQSLNRLHNLLSHFLRFLAADAKPVFFAVSGADGQRFTKSTFYIGHVAQQDSFRLFAKNRRLFNVKAVGVKMNRIPGDFVTTNRIRHFYSPFVNIIARPTADRLTRGDNDRN